jgi:hypothetical protein
MMEGLFQEWGAEKIFGKFSAKERTLCVLDKAPMFLTTGEFHNESKT